MALWTPEYITTALWLQADDLTAGALASWDDDSGNTRNAAHPVSTNQPSVVENELNSLPVVRFDGTNDFLFFPTPPELLANAAKSIFAVFKGRGVGTYDFALATRVNINGVDNDANGYLCIADTRTIYSHVGGGDSIVDPALTRGTAYQCGWTVGSNGATPAHYRDGNALTLTTNTLTTATAELANGYTAIGRQSTAYSGGDLAELIIISGVVDTNTRQRIEGHLAHKWGLTAGLDAGHPYKSTAPQTLSLGNTATLAGTSPVEPVERVLIHRDNAGTLVLEAQIVPDGSGVWEYLTGSIDDHYVTYLAATYPPLTHGPYTPA